MPRVVLTIVLPLVLPSALYLLWLWLVRWSSGDDEPGESLRWSGLPWLWLAAAGAVLLAAVLSVVGGHFGTAGPGVYIPPRFEGGRIVPGHIVPGHIEPGPIESGPIESPANR